MFDIKNKVKAAWEGMWAWVKNSGTILLARLTAAFGFVVAVLASTDWSLLMAMDFSQAFAWNQFTIIGGMTFFKGVVDEITRRSGTKEVAGHLIPTQVSLEPDVKIKTKSTKKKTK